MVYSLQQRHGGRKTAPNCEAQLHHATHVVSVNCPTEEKTMSEIMKIITQAKKESDRFYFWKSYFIDDEDAARAVVENPPEFDDYWRRMMGSPQKYRNHIYREQRRRLSLFKRKIKNGVR